MTPTRQGLGRHCVPNPFSWVLGIGYWDPTVDVAFMGVRGVQVYPLSRLFLSFLPCPPNPAVCCQVFLRREYPPPVSLSFDSDNPLCFQGRWKSPQMPAHYARAQEAERGAIARGRWSGAVEVDQKRCIFTRRRSLG